MKSRKENTLSLLSLVFGGALLIGESVHGLFYGATIQSLLIDYIAGVFLFYAGWQSRKHAHGAVGLLCGAWGYALCDAYRAIWWRTECSP
jgi:predicted MFS family arabinose efflux permease